MPEKPTRRVEMSKEEVVRYLNKPDCVRTLSFNTPKKEDIDTILKCQTMLQCIDGRRREHAMGYPGGKAGVAVALLATVEKFISKDEDLFKKAIQFLEDQFGGSIDFHADDHTKGTLPCSGCGFLRGVLKTNAYGLDTWVQKKLAGYFSDKRALYTYKGNHSEGAVVIVSGPFTVLPSDGSQQVFVLNDGFNKALLTELMRRFCSEFREELSVAGLTERTLKRNIIQKYNQHVRTVVRELAQGKPQYTMIKGDSGQFVLQG